MANEELGPRILVEPTARRGHLDQSLEVALTRGSGREEYEHRRWRAGLIPKGVQTALSHEQEVAGRGVPPARPLKSRTAPAKTKNDSEIVRWKWAPGPEGSELMSQR